MSSLHERVHGAVGRSTLALLLVVLAVQQWLVVPRLPGTLWWLGAASTAALGLAIAAVGAVLLDAENRSAGE